MSAKKTRRQTPATKKTGGKGRSVWLALIDTVKNSKIQIGKFIKASGLGTILLTIILLPIILLPDSHEWVLDLLRRAIT